MDGEGKPRREWPNRRKVRYGVMVRLSLVLPALLTGAAALASFYCLRCFTNGYYWGGVYMKEAWARPGFDGDSTELRRAEIVPTLDTPIGPQKSIVWAVAPVSQRPAPGQDTEIRLELDVAFPTRLAKDFFPAWAFKDSLGQYVQTSFFGMPLDSTQELQILYASDEIACGPARGEVIFDPSP